MPKSFFSEPPKPLQDLILRSAHEDVNVAVAAQHELAKALEQPLRKGILAGNIVNGIFQPFPLAPNASPEFSLDFLTPDVEKEHVAYTIPGYGRLPERSIEGDYIMVNTYEIGNTIDWPLRLVRQSRWDIVSRAMSVFEAGFVKKNNNDGWHVLMTAAKDRGVVIYDGNAGPGRLTLKLLTNMDQAMRRNAGGNSTSLTHGKLTDLFMSIEALEDMRSWTIADIDEVTRREIVTSQNGYVNQIFNINLHELYELGVGQEYQNFYSDASGLNGQLAPGDVEVVVGLDLQENDSFINPIRQQIEVFEDTNLHRSRRAGFYGWSEVGYACLDARRILLGSL